MPVVIAVAVWGKQWPGQTVLVCSDNMAVVAAGWPVPGCDNDAPTLLPPFLFCLSPAKNPVRSCPLQGKSSSRCPLM